ncbi:MAG: FG-GAP-like repeat-containing protein [Candidatus Sulfotelmatobacter sp.]
MLKRTLSGLVLYILSGALLAHAGQFLEAPEYTTGTSPQAVAVGDFNGDGKLDVAVVNGNANTVSVMLGNGDGTFQAKTDFATGSTPRGIVVGHFTSSGNLDIAVTNFASNTVSVLLGNGDGTFQAKKDTAVGSGPIGIAVSDFNNDGNSDLVVTNSTDPAGTVSVLFGQGNGSFAAQVAYVAGSTPVSVAVGDFNGDGVTDLVVANNNSNANVVSVLLGNSNGTFQAKTSVPVGNTPVSVAVADFDNDLKLDIVVADQQGNTVSVVLGNGDGSFKPHVEYFTAAFPTGVVVGDFNGDGKLDLAVSAGNGNTVSVLWGMGDGTFVGQVNAGSGDIPLALASGDFNGDGKLDLVTANSGRNSVSVILNNGNETFQARSDYPAGAGPFSVAAADFTSSGILDLAVVNTGSTSTVSILLGNGSGQGNGTFQGPGHFNTGHGSNPYAVATGDFNGDGIQDMVVANYATNTIGYMQGVGDGTFLPPVTTAVGSGPAAIVVADFNGDGKLDLAVANFNSNNVSILLGNGNGTFQAAINYAVGNGPISLAAGTLKGSGTPLDLVVVNESDNTISVLVGKGDGTFPQVVGPYATQTPAGGNPTGVVIGDFNKDGNLDLAVADFIAQEVSVFLGNGDGTFQTAKTYAAGANPSSIVMADFNGDGNLDLATTSTPSPSNPGNLVTLLMGNGDGTFGAPILFGVGSLAYSAVVGDFNGDGAPDIAVANGGAGSVSVLLNTQGTNIQVQSSATPAVYGQTVQLVASVQESVPNGAAPTGTVTLSNGSTVLGTGSVGSALTVTTSTLPVGSNQLSAAYSGDSNYLKHTVTFVQTVNKAGTTTGLSAPVDSSYPNQTVTFTATVTSNTTGVPTGSVTFMNGAIFLSTVPVNGSGVASLSVALPLGQNSVAAVYSGDPNFNGSTGNWGDLVQKASTTVSLVAPNAVNLSQSVTFTATVAVGPLGTPTGTVNFMDGGSPVGSSSLNASGVATLSISTLAAGTHNITAVYNGDNNYSSITSSQQSVDVTGFSITSAALLPASVMPGSSSTANVTIVGLGGLDPSNVKLSCAVTPATNPAATCTLGATSVTGANGTAVLTVSTAGPQAALGTPAGQRGSGTLFAFGLIVPAMLLGGAGISKPNRRKLLGFCLIFLVLGGCMLQSACGSSGSNHTSTGNSGTPAGAYSVVVTGAANGVQHSTSSMTLTVQ